MLEAMVTMGGFGALLYAKFRLGKTSKDIGKNIALTDSVAFGGTLSYWQKNPINAMGDIIGIYSEPIVKKVKSAISYVGKQITKGIDKVKNIWDTTTKYVGKVTTPVVNVVKNGFTSKKTVKSTNKGNISRSIGNPRSKVSQFVSATTRPIVRVTKPLIKRVIKPVVKVIKPVVKPLVKPIVKAVKPVVNKIKQIFKPFVPQKPKVNPPKKRKRRR